MNATRRTFLAQAATLPVAAAVLSAPLALPALAASNPDAELLAAFEEWKRASIIAENLPDEMSEEDREPYWAKVYVALDRMGELPALTPAGATVKLRLLFAAVTEMKESYDTIWFGTQPTDEALSDYRYRMLWSLIGDTERMSTAVLAA